MQTTVAAAVGIGPQELLEHLVRAAARQAGALHRPAIRMHQAVHPARQSLLAGPRLPVDDDVCAVEGIPPPLDDAQPAG